MIKLLNSVVDFIFPESCILCEFELNKKEKHICSSCAPLLAPFEPSIYDSHKKFMGRIKIENVNAMYLYSKSSYVQKLIHQIKYKSNKDLAHILGKEYAYKNELSSFDLIIPVPLHSKKLKSRGYNQSMEWAKGISDQSKIEAKELLERLDNTETQTKRKRIDRWENVQHSFSLNPGIDIKGKKILLVDDVITTGATIESCAQILLDNNVREVHVAAIGIAH